MKKITILALCLLLVLGSSHAAVSVRTDESAALLENDGSVIVPVNTCDDIVSLGEGWFAAGLESAYALMDSGGQLHTDYLYSDIYYSDSAFIACRDGNWGLLDLQGAETVQFCYQKVLNAGNGVFWALKGREGDLESDELFLLKADGSETATGLYIRSMGSAGEGLLSVQMPDDGLWGYCDARGKMAIPASFDYAGGFSCGTVAVVRNGKYGAVDKNGGVVADFQYDYLEISQSGILIAQQTGKHVLVMDASGTEIARHEGGEIIAAPAGNGYSIATGDRMFFFDEKNNLAAQASGQASAVAGLNGRLIISDGAWGEACVYIAGTDALYQNIYPLGMAGAEELYAFMDVHAARYVNDRLGEIQYAVDMENARYGVLDASGREILPAEYESIEYIGDDRLLVCLEGQWQMIDSAGTVYWVHGIRQSEEASF